MPEQPESKRRRIDAPPSRPATIPYAELHAKRIFRFWKVLRIPMNWFVGLPSWAIARWRLRTAIAWPAWCGRMWRPKKRD